MFETYLIGFVSGGLLLLAGQRISRGNSRTPDKAARYTLYFLLTILLVLLTLFVVLDHQQQISTMVLLAAMPATLATIPLIYIHWRRTPSLQTRQITITIMAGAVAVGILIFAYAQIQREFFIPSLIAGGGGIVLLVWWAAQTRGLGHWLAGIGLVILLAAIFVRQFVHNGILAAWPVWLQNGLDILTLLLLPTTAVTLIGVITDRYIAAASTLYSKFAGLVAIGLLTVIAAYHLNEIMILDSATDDLGGVMSINFFTVSAFAVALVLAWKNWRTALIFALVMVPAAFAMGTIIRNNPDTSPPEVVKARAAQIDTAIQHYYADNGLYPADLTQLIPRYLLYIPNPILFDRQSWCYEGSGDYYRFGYVHRQTFGVPAEHINIRIAGSAGMPEVETWVCDEQLADYRARYGIPMRDF